MISNGPFNSHSAFLAQMMTKLRKRQGSINRTDAGLEESSGCEDKDSETAGRIRLRKLYSRCEGGYY